MNVLQSHEAHFINNEIIEKVLIFNYCEWAILYICLRCFKLVCNDKK